MAEDQTAALERAHLLDRAVQATANEISNWVSKHHKVVFSATVREADLTKLKGLYWDEVKSFKDENGFTDDRLITEPKIVALKIYTVIKYELQMFDVDVRGGVIKGESVAKWGRQLLFSHLINGFFRINIRKILTEEERKGLKKCFSLMESDPREANASLYLLMMFLQRIWPGAPKPPVV